MLFSACLFCLLLTTIHLRPPRILPTLYIQSVEINKLCLLSSWSSEFSEDQTKLVKYKVKVEAIIEIYLLKYFLKYIYSPTEERSGTEREKVTPAQGKGKCKGMGRIHTRAENTHGFEHTEPKSHKESGRGGGWLR